MTGSVTAVSFAISLVESNASTVKYGQGKPVEKSHRNWPLLRRSKLRHRGIYWKGRNEKFTFSRSEAEGTQWTEVSYHDKCKYGTKSRMNCILLFTCFQSSA